MTISIFRRNLILQINSGYSSFRFYCHSYLEGVIIVFFDFMLTGNENLQVKILVSSFINDISLQLAQVSTTSSLDNDITNLITQFFFFLSSRVSFYNFSSNLAIKQSKQLLECYPLRLKRYFYFAKQKLLNDAFLVKNKKYSIFFLQMQRY